MWVGVSVVQKKVNKWYCPVYYGHELITKCVYKNIETQYIGILIISYAHISNISV